MHYKTVFLSDLHLASKKAKHKPLIDFLKTNTFDNIYLVGDIIDIWRFKDAFSMKHDKQLGQVEVVFYGVFVSCRFSQPYCRKILLCL